MKVKLIFKSGIGLIEIIVALALVGSLLAISSQLLSYTLIQIRRMEDQSKASHFAQDAIEATKNIRDRKWEDIENLYLYTSYYPQIVQGQWSMQLGTEQINGYTRDLFFDQVYRDENGQIVESSDRVDENMRKVTSRVCWGNILEPIIYFIDGTTNSDLTNFPNNSGWGDPGQSFTTSNQTESVRKVSLYLAKTEADPSNIYLEIRKDSTIGEILGTSNTIEASNLSNELAWQDFMFSQEIILNPNTKYFLRLRSIPESTIAFSGAEGPIIWGYKHNHGYSGGEAWRYIEQNGNPSYGGLILDQYDFSFKIHKTPCPNNQEKYISLSNYLTNWQYVSDFVSYFSQTNQEDFESGLGNNVDTFHHMGSLVLALNPLMNPAIYNFESYGVNQDPANWSDTGENFSLNPYQEGFKTAQINTINLGTATSEKLDIHTHFTGSGAVNWKNYEFKGRFMITDSKGGIGLTFLSKYPAEDKYYRLGSFGTGNTWHIEARNTTLSGLGVNDRDTEVVVESNKWYWLRMQVKDVNNQNLIVAKVWLDGAKEPASWQIDCFDESSTRPITGTVGLWTSGKGNKYIDDVELRDLTKYIDTSTTGAGTLESSIFDTGAPSNFGKIIWQADNPTGAHLQFQIRSATDRQTITTLPWSGPTGLTDYYETTPEGEKINLIHKGDQFIQYKIFLTSDNVTITPMLQEIKISYVNQ